MKLCSAVECINLELGRVVGEVGRSIYYKGSFKIMKL